MISHSAWKWVHFSVCSAQAAEALESSHIHNNPEALYSMPIKRGQKAPSSQSLRTTMEVRDAMQQVHDLSSEDEMKESSRVSLYWVHWCTCKRYVGELRLFFWFSSCHQQSLLINSCCKWSTLRIHLLEGICKGQR